MKEYGGRGCIFRWAKWSYPDEEIGWLWIWILVIRGNNKCFPPSLHSILLLCSPRSTPQFFWVLSSSPFSTVDPSSRPLLSLSSLSSPHHPLLITPLVFFTRLIFNKTQSSLNMSIIITLIISLFHKVAANIFDPTYCVSCKTAKQQKHIYLLMELPW